MPPPSQFRQFNCWSCQQFTQNTERNYTSQTALYQSVLQQAHNLSYCQLQNFAHPSQTALYQSALPQAHTLPYCQFQTLAYTSPTDIRTPFTYRHSHALHIETFAHTSPPDTRTHFTSRHSYTLHLHTLASPSPPDTRTHYNSRHSHTLHLKTLAQTSTPDNRTPFTYCCSFNWKRNTNGNFVLSIITFVLSIITFVLSNINFVLSIINFVLSIFTFVLSIFNLAFVTVELLGLFPGRFIPWEEGQYKLTRRLFQTQILYGNSNLGSSSSHSRPYTDCTRFLREISNCEV